jgi:hypothetical protein
LARASEVSSAAIRATASAWETGASDTRYDKLVANFLSGVAIATALAFWL